ncbi:hypothetical protein I545_1366 [Mycobacterium kansasii 662]|uniref:Uncharacterized protein n=2 Tax=Mycobacterium kansasii TaxID=1768 RepID=A0A1V3XT55_MYCKA|nr:hypothetical protein I547_5240 [Mycobacterium kansasii 824]EUA21528.1 hypothetical protein I545_1366 [Mycobacterium kansasii 662]OOK66175.1 hypothetical protein BZL29_7632 [Mycobacterium kansasii]OOK82230.1 hypothetical protein BZL30_0145 [Mycobacterium kansasii]
MRKPRRTFHPRLQRYRNRPGMSGMTHPRPADTLEIAYRTSRYADS